jgi:hypothetical protein
MFLPAERQQLKREMTSIGASLFLCYKLPETKGVAVPYFEGEGYCDMFKVTET